MLQCKWTKKNAVITVTVTVLIFSPFLYMFFLGQTYGMPDEIRTAVDCVGKEINTLWAHNAVLETYDTTNSSDPIAKNNERVDNLFAELDRLWPAGSLRYLTEVSNIMGFEHGCLSSTGGIPVRQAEEFRNVEDVFGVAVGGTDMFVSGILSGLSACTSGVVVERVSHDGIVETGILTNQHCGDVFSLRVNDASVDVEKVAGSWFCDCAFVRTGDLFVDPNAVWTDWGTMHVSGYKDFKNWGMGRVSRQKRLFLGTGTKRGGCLVFQGVYRRRGSQPRGQRRTVYRPQGQDLWWHELGSTRRKYRYGCSVWVRMVGRAAELGRVRTVIYANMITVESQTARSASVRNPSADVCH